KASIAWRTLRAQLLARRGQHDEARQVAEEAVSLAERTDALVDHGDASLALATVLDAAGESAAAHTAAARALDLYERKGAVALAEKARRILGEPGIPTVAAASGPTAEELDNACTRVIRRAAAAVDREAWDEIEQFFTPTTAVESRRKVVGFPRIDLPSSKWRREVRRYLQDMRPRHYAFVAVRGERVGLARLVLRAAEVSPGAPEDEVLELFALDEEGRIALQVWFDIDDIDAAMAELDAVHARFEAEPPHTRLENAASRVRARFNALFAESRFEEAAALWADGVRVEDRRRGLRSDAQYDRAGGIAEIRAMADLGVKTMTSDVIAVRGDRLELSRTRYSGRDTSPNAFHTEVLRITEIDIDQRCVATIAFDHDDLDAAFAELDARYLAGEAAPYADTWSVITKAYTGMCRGAVPATAPDLVNVDHRHVTPMAPDDGIAYLHASWDMAPEFKLYVEAVHQLSEVGAVFTRWSAGTSQDGFDAEWRAVDVVTVEGDLIERGEIFDEADLEIALARFDELSRPTPRRLENAASRVNERIQTLFASRNWDAIKTMLAEGIRGDDRRRVVNAGLRQGRDATIADLSAIAEVGVTDVVTTVVATRGQRLSLSRGRASQGDQPPEAFHTDLLDVVEIDDNEHVVARIVFDADDIDAAFAELDARYVAGEGAAHAHTWSVIARGYAAINRRELPATTPDWVNIDHQRGNAFAPGELTEYIRAAWNQPPDIKVRIAAVHRLSDRGGVFTRAGDGSSQEGFDAEWRVIDLFTVAGDVISRCEVFDEADLDAALARFDELDRPVQRLENAASRQNVRIADAFNRRDLEGYLGTCTADARYDDHRQGLRGEGPIDAEFGHALLFEAAESWCLEVEPIALRGQRLALSRYAFCDASEADRPIVVEAFVLTEVTDDQLVSHAVIFDADDIETARAELETRYLAGDAAPHAHTWSLVIAAYAAFNRQEISATTPDWVSIDHRRGASFAPGDMAAYLSAAWEDSPGTRIYIDTVHRLTNLGAVVTHASKGVSRDGFEAEWRDINVLTVEGHLINRSELYNEADLDEALARFDELSRRERLLENAASHMYQRFNAAYLTGDWDALAATMSDNFFADDRRRFVGSGSQQGRDAAIAHAQVTADLGVKNATSTVVATRGANLVLVKARFWGRDERPDAFDTEVLHLIQSNSQHRVATFVAFDIDDIDAAFAELDARYLADEAVAHRLTWSLIMRVFAEFNSRQLPSTAIEWVDHRH
ncbi:hypothetical protein, partial [Micromonospora sp. WMMD736]|uniref:hypothetical protein n=1 Tax=Micromonospora sp. WMMD736 TaxID=3404112 RepID=UPI003B9392A1